MKKSELKQIIKRTLDELLSHNIEESNTGYKLPQSKGGKYQVKYAKSKKDKIQVTGFNDEDSARKFLADKKKNGFNGIISLNGKPIKELDEEKDRDYKEEYANYHSKPEQKKNRAKRNNARQRMEREGRVKKGDGKDVDHKKPLRSGGGNSDSNLRVQSKSTNRANNGS